MISAKITPFKILGFILYAIFGLPLLALKWLFDL